VFCFGVGLGCVCWVVLVNEIVRWREQICFCIFFVVLMAVSRQEVTNMWQVYRVVRIGGLNFFTV